MRFLQLLEHPPFPGTVSEAERTEVKQNRHKHLPRGVDILEGGDTE